jgi:hypothetical protein
MTTSIKDDLEDVAILTLAVESVFRKLIRLLIGKISLKKLQEMIQVIFVEEAEVILKKEKPGKNVALSALAVVSGIDTRTLTRIKSQESYLKPFHEEKRFLRKITPECSVLDVWESSETYKDPKTGKPIILAINGPKPSFESLISDSNSTRGVTVKSFLQRLEVSKSVIVDKAKNSVRMIDKRYTPFGSEAQTENARIGMAAVGNLVDTVAHNVKAPTDCGESFFQRGCWTNRLNKDDSKRLRELVKNFLTEADEKVRKMMKPFEQSVTGQGQLTAGVSLFYFEEASLV